MQRTLRWPSSMASPMPTGPPPTMMTCASLAFEPCISGVFISSRRIHAGWRSLRRDAGLLDDLAPLRNILGDQLAEFVRRPADADKTLGGELLDDLRRAQNLVEDGVVAGDDLARGRRGYQHPQPEIDVDTLDALLGKRGHLRRDTHALLVGHRQETDLVVLGQRQADMDGDEHRADMTTDQVLDGGSRPAIGDVLHVRPGRQLEQLHAEVMRRAAPG